MCLMCNIKTRLGLTYIQFPSCSMMSGFVFFSSVFLFAPQFFSFSLPIQFPPIHTAAPPSLPSSVVLSLSWVTRHWRGKRVVYLSKFPRAWSVTVLSHPPSLQWSITQHCDKVKAVTVARVCVCVCVWINRQAYISGVYQILQSHSTAHYNLSLFLLFCNRLQCGFHIINCPWKTSSEIWMRIDELCKSKTGYSAQKNVGPETFTFSYLADAFIQSDLQMRTMEAIKINKRAMICKCYDKSQLA